MRVRTYVLPHFFPALYRFTREDEGATFLRNVDSHLLNGTFTSQKACIFSNTAARPSHVSRIFLTCVISFCLFGLLSCDTVQSCKELYIQISEEYAAFIYRVEVSMVRASSDCVARLQER